MEMRVLNKDFPLPHPLKDDDIDTLMKKLRMMVRTIEIRFLHIKPVVTGGLKPLSAKVNQ